MRISSNQIYLQGLKNINNQQSRMLQLQQQLSSGKKIESAADDPIASVTINRMDQRIGFTEQLQNNRQSAEAALRTEENMLSNVVGVLQRLREIQVLGGNDALSQDDRKALAEEANNLLKQVQDLANGTDNNGSYLFSGSRTDIAPFTIDGSGNYIYNGDDTIRYQSITQNLRVALNDSGADVFMRIKDGNGRFSISQTGADNTGTAVMTSGSVVDESAYIEDDYTLSFATNTAGETVVMVSGAVSGNVIPPTGLPDDAPVYVEGQSVAFNGIQVEITGTPDAGDDFSIKPSKNQSLFSTIKRMVNNLQKTVTGPEDKAVIQTENNQLMEQIDTVIDHVVIHQTDMGARLNNLDVANRLNADLILSSEGVRSQLEDADIAELATELNRHLVFLQAAQQSFVRVQGLTIFNYL